MPFAQDGAGVGRGSFLLGGSLIVWIAAELLLTSAYGKWPRSLVLLCCSFLLLLFLLLLLPRLLFLLFLVVFQASGLPRFSPKLLCGLVGKWPSPLRDSGFDWLWGKWPFPHPSIPRAAQIPVCDTSFVLFHRA